MSSAETVIDHFILVHGLQLVTVDPTSYWSVFISYLQHTFPSNSEITVTACNSIKGRTTDGILEGAKRLADELSDIFKPLSSQNQPIRRLHFIGHSLGGLHLRGALPLLFEKQIFPAENLQLFNFITLETPHLGVLKPAGNGTFDNLCKNFAPILFGGRSYDELTLQDLSTIPDLSKMTQKVDEKTPIDPVLFQLTSENHLKALRSFKHLSLVQNIGFSYQVPYVSAAIDRGFPYNRQTLKESFLIEMFNFGSEYNDIIKDSDKKYEMMPERGECFVERTDGCVVYDKLVQKLQDLNWRRFNVHIRTKSVDAHIYLCGKLHRQKFFKSWGNEDVKKYLENLMLVLKRDVELA
ncbi:DUF676 domain-containing protein [Entamoeba marina]